MGLITNLTGYRARLRRAVRIAGIGLLAITPVAHAQEPGGDHAGHVMAAVAAADLDSHGIVVDTSDNAHRLANPMVVRPQTAGATRITPSTAGTDCPVIVTMAMAPPMLSPRR